MTGPRVLPLPRSEEARAPVEAESPVTAAAAPRPWAVVGTIVRVVAAIGVLGFLGYSVWRGAPTLETLRPTLRPGPLAAAAALGVAGLLGLAAALPLTLRHLGLYRPRARWFYLRLWLQPYFYRYVPGKVMLVAERVRLGRHVGLPATTSVLLVVWESLFLLVAAGLVVVVALGLGQGSAGGRLPWLLGGALGSALLLALFPPLFSVAGRLPVVGPRLAGLAEVKLSYGAQLQLSLVYALIWTALGTSFALLASTLVELPAGSLPTLVFWYVAAYVIGFVSSLAPGGLGVREGILVAGLGSVLGTGEAVALALAGRLFITALELLCVGATRLIPLPEGEAA